MERQVGFTRELADLVNCPEEDSEALLTCLREVEEKDLTRAQITVSICHLKCMIVLPHDTDATKLNFGLKREISLLKWAYGSFKRPVVNIHTTSN